MKPRARLALLALLVALPLPLLVEGAGSRSSRPVRSKSSRAKKAGSRSSHGVSPRVASLVKRSEQHLRHQAELAGGFLFVRDAAKSTVRALRYASPHHGAKRLGPAAAKGVLARIPGARPKLIPSDQGPIYFVCHDMQDARTEKMVDLDVWMVERGGKLKPVQYLLHKVDGEKRYKYEPGELAAVE